MSHYFLPDFTPAKCIFRQRFMGTHNGTDRQPIPNNWHSERYGSCCGREAHRKGGEMEYFMGEKCDNKWYCWWFRNPANQLRLLVYPIIYKVLYIPGGAGFLPSTVVIPRTFFFGGGKIRSPNSKSGTPLKTRCPGIEFPPFFGFYGNRPFRCKTEIRLQDGAPGKSPIISVEFCEKLRGILWGWLEISPEWNPSDSRPPTWG